MQINIEEIGQLFGAISSVMCTPPIICNTFFFKRGGKVFQALEIIFSSYKVP